MCRVLAHVTLSKGRNVSQSIMCTGKRRFKDDDQPSKLERVNPLIEAEIEGAMMLPTEFHTMKRTEVLNSDRGETRSRYVGI
jgi:hypothetical protein